jgi:GNAT superfamily N-acetyltransferase
MKLEFYPATPDRWKDVEALFGERGACGGCWCRYWKQTRSEYDRNKGDKNRKALRKSVTSGEAPGILAYSEGEPVGWCAVEPRARFSTLSRSRVLAPVDETPVWSAPCLFIRRDFRNRGLSSRLLAAAARYARSRGAHMLEGYPVEPSSGKLPDAFLFTGLPSSFEKAGFHVAARRSPRRPVMRLKLS